MIKKIQLLIYVLPVLFIFNSCFYIVADKPYYYSDYEDPETSASYNYYYSYSYSGYPVYAPSYTPTPAPTPVIKQQTNIYIILKVVDNRHIFYRNNREIAVWHFHPDGRIERKGENINGKVIRYYDNSDMIEWEFEYKDNVRWGQCRRYFNNGKIWEEVYYNNGKREGPYKIFHPNGIIKEEVKYTGGLREGTYRIYQEDGKIIEHGKYKKNTKEVKFRDEKYFKEIKDNRNEVIPYPTGQANIVQTPVQQMKEQPMQNEDKDKKKEKEKGNIKNIIQEQANGQGQEIIEQQLDAGQTTKNSQAEQKIMKVKKQEDKKQFKVKYNFGQEKKLDEETNKDTIKKDSKSESLQVVEEINTMNPRKDKELKEDRDKEDNNYKKGKKKGPALKEQ